MKKGPGLRGGFEAHDSQDTEVRGRGSKQGSGQRGVEKFYFYPTFRKIISDTDKKGHADQRCVFRRVVEIEMGRPRSSRRTHDLTTPDTTDRPLLVHVHMPKAGGTSLDGVLKMVYGDKLLIAHPTVGWPQIWPADFVRMIEADGHQFDAFSGHITYGVHELFRRSAIYISTVRDPVERFESYFNFIKHWKIHHHHEVAKDMSMSEFFRFMEGRGDIELYNLQCLLICGHKNFEAAAEMVRDKFFAVLPLSRFEECVHSLAKRLRWPPVTVPRYNTTEHKSDIGELTRSQRDALIEGNRDDAKLVAFCESQIQRWAST
jgi:hypothetical protein